MNPSSRLSLGEALLGPLECSREPLPATWGGWLYGIVTVVVGAKRSLGAASSYAEELEMPVGHRRSSWMESPRPIPDAGSRMPLARATRRALFIAVAIANRLSAVRPDATKRGGRQPAIRRSSRGSGR